MRNGSDIVRRERKRSESSRDSTSSTIENESSSPLIEGEIENGSYLDRVYEDSGYENEVMRVRTLNVRVTF